MLIVERKARKWGYYREEEPDIATILNRADDELFRKVVGHPYHVLGPQLPPVKQAGYSFRPRGHSLELPRKSTLTAKNFLIRMLYLSV